MSKTFDRLSDLILQGEPGDMFHDLPKDKDRSVETYIMQGREETENSERGEVEGRFHTITTQHYGRAEFSGRPAYKYVSVESPGQRVSSDGMFLRYTISMGGSVYRVGEDVPAKRFGKAKLMTLHREALGNLGISTEGL